MIEQGIAMNNGRVFLLKNNQVSWAFALIIGLTIALRMVFYSGYIGSDDVTYTLSADKILHGDWSLSNYIGALRFGINIPVAIMMAVFGSSEYSANLWSFLCSVAEVGLVFYFANQAWGLRTAIYSSIILAVLPLHVQYAGRLLADSPLAFFITLSFVLFWLAEQKSSAVLYICSGLAIGASFWVKESPLVFSVVFGLYPLYYQYWNNRWLLVVVAACIPVTAQFAFMWAMAGDPLHIFHSLFRSEYMAKVTHILEQKPEETSFIYYFKYLFVDIKHTWLLGFLWIAGVLSLAQRKKSLPQPAGRDFVLIWSAGLVAVFTFFPMSLHPFKFIMKQANYMLIFMAPMALLSGCWLSGLKSTLRVPVFSLYVLGSIILCGLEQQATQVFTANSKATYQFALSHVGTPVFALSNAHIESVYQRIFTGNDQQLVRPLDDIIHPTGPAQESTPPAKAYAIVDMHTLGWSSDPIKSLGDVPACWQNQGALAPPRFSTAGGMITKGILGFSAFLPGGIAKKVESVVQPLLVPKPAYVFAVPAECIAPQS